MKLLLALLLSASLQPELPARLGETVCISESEGILAMRRQVERATAEHAWEYANGCWVDISDEVSSDEARLNEPLMRTLLKEHENLRLWHTHPFTKESRYAFPSADDIMTTIDVAIIHRSHHKKGMVTGSVASAYGIASLNVTEEGIAYFAQHQNEEENYSNLLVGRLHDLPRVISPFTFGMQARRASDKYVQVSFALYR